MSGLADLVAEPWRFDMFAVLRHFERNNPGQPRIGDSATIDEDYVRLGEEPYLDFPASNIQAARPGEDGQFRLFVKFLGLLGPQGPLPLAMTEETYGWSLQNDDAFPRFLDLFNNRFLQLFFRAWAESKPIAHHDRPDADRFADYVGSMIGVGTSPFKHLDRVPDIGKMSFAGLIAPRTKSASRLASFISGLFGVSVDVQEFVGSWLLLEPDDRTTIGRRQSSLGIDVVLGASIYSVQDKIRIRVRVDDLESYRSFLPTGPMCGPLTDAVSFYADAALDWEVELAIPTKAIKPMQIGRSGELGWTSWLSPFGHGADPGIRADARFNPAERSRQSRSAAAS